MHPEQTRPAPSAIEAAVSLLADADARIAAACRRQVLSWGAAAVPVLRAAARGQDPRLRARARAVLRTLNLQQWSADFARFARVMNEAPARRRGDCRALEVGAALISAIGRDSAPTPEVVGAVLEGHARVLRSRVRGRTAASCARVLGDYLAREVGFSASSASYYDSDAVMLDRVLQGRCAIPFALALVYLLVGRRAGLRVTAVALPEEWLVRVHGARPVLVDPVRGGRSLTKGDCIRHLRVTGHGRAPSTCLADLDDRAVLRGHLASLRRVFGYHEDAEALAAVRQADDVLALPGE